MKFGDLLRRRLGAWALLVALAVGPFGPVAQLHDDTSDDPACVGPAPMASVAWQSPALSAPAAGTGDGHCAVCHWLHAVRWAALAQTPTTADDPTLRSLAPVAKSRAVSGPALPPAARSPPPATTAC